MAKFFRAINRRSGWVTYIHARELDQARRKMLSAVLRPVNSENEYLPEERKDGFIILDKDWIIDNGKKEIKRYRSKKDKEWRYYTSR